MEMYNKIINYFKENEEIFNQCIEKLDDCNGCLDDQRYYDMELFDDFFDYDAKPLEIVERVYFGYDEIYSAPDDHGLPFCPNHTYFKLNGYGNFISADHKNYYPYLDNYLINSMLENRQYIDEIDYNADLSKLFDELENER